MEQEQSASVNKSSLQVEIWAKMYRDTAATEQISLLKQIMNKIGLVSVSIIDGAEPTLPHEFSDLQISTILSGFGQLTATKVIFERARKVLNRIIINSSVKDKYYKDDRCYIFCKSPYTLVDKVGIPEAKYDLPFYVCDLIYISLHSSDEDILALDDSLLILLKDAILDDHSFERFAGIWGLETKMIAFADDDGSDDEGD